MCLGIPGRVIERRDDAGLPVGTVDFGGVRREVCLAYVADEVSVPVLLLATSELMVGATGNPRSWTSPS